MVPKGEKSDPRRALAIALMLLVLCGPAHGAAKYKVLHKFSGPDGDGPWDSVTLGPKGILYGTTASGGSGTGCTGGCGVVFKLTPHAGGKWTETVLHNFEYNHQDGYGPYGNITIGPDGHLYGTTWLGGTEDAGTVFELTHGSNGWAENVAYSFGTQHGDEGKPVAGVALDGKGNLYGTTETTAFQLVPGQGGWTENVLHRFNITKGDGAAPYAGLIQDASGNLYGTTAAGGRGCGGEGCGTVYGLSPVSGGGWKEKILHYFGASSKDGDVPGWGPLFMDASGSLYGTTASGGNGSGSGTVFKLTQGQGGRWKESMLYAFQGGAEGNEPNAGVVMDKVGNLYGTTPNGGYDDCGVIYKLAPQPRDKWTYTVLHTFKGPDGCNPEGNLTIDSEGNLYGTTVLGGIDGYYGVIFEITP